MSKGLFGSSKLAKKTVQSQPYEPNPVKAFAPIHKELQKSAERQNIITNGGALAGGRRDTTQSGGAFFLEHAQRIANAKSPSVGLTTPAPTPDSTQNIVVIPQFPKNSRTPDSSTAIAEQTIKNQYKQHVQSSTDGGSEVKQLGNQQQGKQKQAGGRRKKRTKKRNKSRKPRRTHKKRRCRTR